MRNEGYIRHTYIYTHTELTFEHYEFELHGSTYIQTLFNKYLLQYYTISSWLNLRMQNCVYGGPTVKLYVDF